MNGTRWGEDNLLVTMSKPRQRDTIAMTQQGRARPFETKRRIVQKWVEKKKLQEDIVMENRSEKAHRQPDQRKVIQAKWDEEQKQRLQRSLLGVCVKPIELQKIMDYLLEEWKGTGEIEDRDVGPYRCLIMFSTTEIRDEAVKNQLIQSVFDEVQFHWDFFWSLSRRDDRTEESKSFSTARLMIDSFQWHMIHEWVNVNIDNHIFEVFVKEVGSENYSVKSHPNRGEGKFEWMEVPDDDHEKLKIQATMENIPATSMTENLKLPDVMDPTIEAIINRTLNDEYHSN
ncbi:hypothetical protein PIB30_024771 [Stylosanthes scabra]|uniref:Uncharacterized protein n=1 Tax=Stylosanthes scabra TaxID=79078 RepID=A0ABU6UA65_9FABA|nr:hypothetical protein [Stylosanthes scabra]